MERRLCALVALSCLVLAACGGGGSPSGPLPAPAGGASASTDATVQLIVPTAATAARRGHKASFVSAATQSATIVVGASTAIVDLSASSTSCSTQSQGRLCTAAVAVPFGSDTFVVTTFDQAPVHGAIPAGAHVLGTGSVTQTIAPNSTAVSIAIDAVVNGFGTFTAFASWPADGVARSYGFVLNPVDFDNAPIQNHASDPFANPITVTLTESGGSGHAHLALNGASSGTSATLQSAADSVSVVYDGGGSPGYGVSIAFAATGVSTVTLTRSPLFVTSTSTALSGYTVSLTGTSSTVAMTIAEANAPGSVTFSATPSNCTNIASVTQPALVGTSETFSITGGTVASAGGCTVAVSDGTSTISIAVHNAVASASPSPTPSASPTASPSPSPSPSPTATPLLTPSPLPASIYVSNGYVWNTFPLAAAQAAGGTYNAAPATTISFPNTYTSYFAVDKLHNLIWLSGGHAYPASWNGAAPSPVMTLTGGGSGGIASDSSGNVYQNTSSFSSFTIAIYPYGSTTAGTTLQLPAGQNAVSIALDASGNIYYSDNGSNTVDVVANPGPNAGIVTGSVTRTISGIFHANWGMCVDSSGRLYVVDTNGPSGTVDIFAAGTTNAASSTPIETIASSAFGGTPEFCDVDPSGNVWVTDLYDVQEFTAAQITSNLGGSISAAANRISGAATTLNSATGIYIR